MCSKIPIFFTKKVKFRDTVFSKWESWQVGELDLPIIWYHCILNGSSVCILIIYLKRRYTMSKFKIMFKICLGSILMFFPYCV